MDTVGHIRHCTYGVEAVLSHALNKRYWRDPRLV